MTLFLLRGLFGVGKEFWELMENIGKSSDMVLFLGLQNENPTAASDWRSRSGQIASAQEDSIVYLIFPMYHLYEPFHHNIELRKKLTPFLGKIARKRNESSDCITDFTYI